MDTTQVYIALRSEILANHVLLQCFTLITAVSLIIGVVVVERLGNTVLSVFLPLLSLAWAASVVRFDFFIHRQAAYLRILETQANIPMWETWKGSLRSTAFVIPFADIIATTAIVVPTIYLLFGPAKHYFKSRSWRGVNFYAFGVSSLMILLLLSLTVIPKLAAY
jgi:hypothetical protein